MERTRENQDNYERVKKLWICDRKDGPSTVSLFDEGKARTQDSKVNWKKNIWCDEKNLDIFFFLLPDKGNLPNSTHSLKHTDTTVNHSAQTAADHRGLGKHRGQNEESKIKEKAGG